ncbi:hypothetical protein CN975_28730 [Bacillus cereus]|uniref:DUF998 domain-containing protein n=1 Tax=Bacillus TaxID=1386 RepID=UPI000BF4AB06|nr:MULTISPECIES: DUF998 domain-containing protein [Bacillus]MEB9409615.1 DUF998 domain-containing protein [Bacillus cereus]MEB9857442.1 DUF998 domain-containing protein [Bacillus cereus]PER08346.1 hypothetical protein CN477_00120 [Bacillus cereus]PFB99392.1 hypothetical protein CN280_25340 [Bacillus cereus]PFF14259.1 hypothetical protein CN343_12510 [Bacillus cereus]
MYISNRIGLFSWITTCIYFLIEPFFIFTSTVPYNYLHHAMSDLGVTTCGKFTYEIAPYEICSPNHFWMNLLFIINGLTFCVGVLYISQHLEKTKINKIATFFILIIGVSTIVSGLIPADVNLIGHSILVWIGMLTVYPGLFIFARNLKKAKKWTYFCLLSLILIIILISLVFLFPLPSGLLQRLFYLVLFVWGTVSTYKLIR